MGLAGGSNLYGFANGDPVNNSDPFGLCPGLNGSLSPFDCPPGYFTVLGAVLGLFDGGITGGGMGAALALPTGETIGPITISAGAIAGGIAGAVNGAVAGAAVDATVHMARAGRGGGNSAENRGSNYYAKKYRLNKAGAEQLKRTLEDLKRTGETITDETLDTEAKGIADTPKFVNK